MAQVPATEVSYTGGGGTTQFAITFEYIDRTEVKVSVDGVNTPFTFATDTLVNISPAPAPGTIVRVYRDTKAFEVKYIFEDGVPFLTRYADLNWKSILFAIQETWQGITNLTSLALSRWNRTIRTEEPIDPLYTDAAGRANKALGFDLVGEPTVIGPATNSKDGLLSAQDKLRIDSIVDSIPFAEYPNVPTRAHLAAILPSLPLGSAMTTRGCDIEGDGGHGTFDIVASTSIPVDGYSVIGSGPYAILRTTTGRVTPEQFGGRGDDSTDCYAAFVRAGKFSSAKNASIECNGVYRLSQSWEPPSNLHLTGRGTLKSVASPINTGGRTHFGLLYFYLKTNITIDAGLNFDLSLITTLPSGAASVRAITFYGCSDFYVDKVDCITPGGAIACMGCHDYIIDGATGTATADFADAVFDNWGEANANFHSFHLLNLKIYGENKARWGVLANGQAYGSYSLSGYDFFIDNIYAENCTLDAVWCGGRAPTIHDIHVTNITSKNCRKGLSLSDVIRANVSNIIVNGSPDRGIDLWTETVGGGVTGVRDSVFNGIVLNNVASSRGGGAQPAALDVQNGCTNNIFDNIRITGSTHYFGIAFGSTSSGNRLGKYIINAGTGDKILNYAGTANILNGSSYTPTLFNSSNVSASSNTRCIYTVEGNTCFVDFWVSVTPTANATFTQLGISVPLPGGAGSNFSCFGHATGGASAVGFNNAVVSGDTVNLRAQLIFLSNHTDAREYKGRFCYNLA